MFRKLYLNKFVKNLSHFVPLHFLVINKGIYKTYYFIIHNLIQFTSTYKRPSDKNSL